MPLDREGRHNISGGIKFSDDDADDPFSNEKFRALARKYDISNRKDTKCGELFTIELSKSWDHVKVLVENTGNCDVTVRLGEGRTKNWPNYPGNTEIKASTTAAKKEAGKDPHNGRVLAEGVNFIEFECSSSDFDLMGDDCKFEYKVRAY